MSEALSVEQLDDSSTQEARILLENGFRYRWGASIRTDISVVTALYLLKTASKPAHIVARNLMHNRPTLLGPLTTGDVETNLDTLPTDAHYVRFGLWEPASDDYVIPEGFKVLGEEDFDPVIWTNGIPLSPEAVEEAIASIVPMSPQELGVYPALPVYDDWPYEVD